MPSAHPDLAPAGSIDTHVHIFRQNAPLSADRRYAPDYDALPDALMQHMDGTGIARALLVQPSFLGTDNSFLLEAIADRPDRFAGIAVIPPGISRQEMTRLRSHGIVGVRLNCIGRPLPDLSGDHRGLVTTLADLGLVLQIQAEGDQWLGLKSALATAPLPLVIDHFGRTAPQEHNGAFLTLLRAAEANPQLWFKFAAPYRLAEGAAASCATALLAAVGPERIVWGSDWPHTQFENRQTYSDTLGWLSRWVQDADIRQAILCRNPVRLFGL